MRDELVVSSKVGFPVGEDPKAQGLSRRHIMRVRGTAFSPVVGISHWFSVNRVLSAS
jgi:hypothetical protein